MSLIRNAVAATLALGAAGSAQALNISTYATNAPLSIYVGGSTAVDNTFLNSAIASISPFGLCEDDSAGVDANTTIDVYQIGSPTQRLIYCKARSGVITGVAAGTPIAIFKESINGSVDGIQPLVNIHSGNPSGIGFLSPSALVTAGGDAACTAGAVVAHTAATLAYINHVACPATAVTTNQAPSAGVADVEGSMLRTIPNGGTLPDFKSYITSAPTLDVGWGVAVTKNLFYALQTAENLTSTCPTVTVTTGTTTSTSLNLDAPTCAPSLSKQQVASLFQGTKLLTWNQILGLNNTVDNNVYVCRRDVGSGTEASYEALFMGARCSASSEVIAGQDGAYVFTSGGTGGVRNCLGAFFAGGTVTPYNGDFSPATTFTPVTLAGGQWAIGMVSTEVKASDLTASASNNCPDCFRFVAVDGVMPTLPNEINGYYPYFSTGVAYTINQGQTGAPSTAQAAVFSAITGRLGHPVFTANSNVSYQGRPWGDGGDLAPAPLFGATNPPTVPATFASAHLNPVNAFSKGTGGSINNCDTPTLWDSSASTPANTILGTGNVNHQ